MASLFASTNWIVLDTTSLHYPLCLLGQDLRIATCRSIPEVDKTIVANSLFAAQPLLVPISSIKSLENCIHKLKIKKIRVHEYVPKVHHPVRQILSFAKFRLLLILHHHDQCLPH